VIELPQVGGQNRQDAKSAIIRTLSEKWPLSAKQIHSAVSKDGGRLTYQAIHKSLGELLEAGTVSKANSGYSLSLDWIVELRKFSEKLEYEYSGKKKLSLNRSPGLLFVAARTFSLLTNLIFKNNLRLEHDAMYLFGNRVNMVPTHLLVSLTKDLNAAGKTSLLYRHARESGYEWSKAVISRGFVHSPEELTFHGADAFAVAGWPPYAIEEFDLPGKRLTLSVEHSSLALEYLKAFGKTSRPTCDILRGLLAGGFSPVFADDTFEGIETACIIKGDKKCVFVIRPRKFFDLHDPEIQRQLARNGEKLDLTFLKKADFSAATKETTLKLGEKQ